MNFLAPQRARRKQRKELPAKYKLVVSQNTTGRFLLAWPSQSMQDGETIRSPSTADGSFPLRFDRSNTIRMNEQKEGKKRIYSFLTGTHHVLKCFSAVQERVDGQANISTLQFWMLKTYPFSTFLLLLEQPAEQTHHRLNKASTQVKLSAQQDPL